MSFRYVKLGSLFNITSGGTPSRKNKDYYENGDIPWVKTGDLKNMYLSDVDEYITQQALNESSAKLFPKGTVLIAMYGATIGNCSILSIDAATNQACAAFKPNNKIIPEFLYYYLMSIKERLISLAVGGAQPNISISILKNIEIPLLTINEQKRMVSILNKSRELIDKRKAQIEALDELTQSVFLEMFGDLRTNQKGWKIVELSEVVQVDANLVDDIANYVHYPLVGIDNIEKNTGNLINIKTVGESDVKGSKYFFSREHILYSKIRPYLNKVASPSFEGLCSTDAYPLKINKEKANKQFILNILRSKDFVSYAVKHSKGANIPRIDQKQLLNYKTILPDLNTQNQFENIVKKIEIQKEIIKKSLRELENTFNSLMQRAFKGELFND